MSALAATLYAVLVPVCATAALVGFAAWARPGSRRWSQAAEASGLGALGLALAAWILRWTVAGHLPLFGTYESALSLAVAVLTSALAWRWAAGAERGAAAWPVAAAVAAGLLAHGLRFDPSAFPLTISERSWAVDLHALLAWAAFGTLTVNVGFAVRRMTGRPPHDDRWLVASLGVGFGLHTAMIASGSFYEFLLFGRAWSFDPVETLAFAAWLAYGALLHMHRFAGWQGRRLARWCVGLFAVLVVSYRFVVHFPPWSTYHIFDMDRRVHVTGSPTAPL